VYFNRHRLTPEEKVAKRAEKAAKAAKKTEAID